MNRDLRVEILYEDNISEIRMNMAMGKKSVQGCGSINMMIYTCSIMREGRTFFQIKS